MALAVAVVAYDDAELLDIACVTTTLATATRFLAGQDGAPAGYDVRLPATTHWAFADGLARDHPAVTVAPDPIFIRDGRVATSAGVTSALDLTLAFVDEDHGPDLARRVARALVPYLQRPGTQAQMSMHVAGPAAANDVVRDVVDHVAAHLDGDLSTAALAERAGSASAI